VGEGALRAGADRFSGFGDLYDGVRPVPPIELGELVAAYCELAPKLVVDMGSGTGLSTRWAAGWAVEVVGVEPSQDMREIAERHAAPGVTFVEGWSHQTGVPAGTADAVLAVQALHWMEPEPTFQEVARVLRPGGVFAAIDCDWPPVVGDHIAERAWDDCRRQIRVYESRLADGLSGDALRASVSPADRDGASYSSSDAHRNRRLPEGVRSWSKSGHLDRLNASGLFAWCREVALASTDRGDAERFVGLLKSQGDYQALRRYGLDDADLGVDCFEHLVNERLGHHLRPWRFIYRARLAFTP
jgi:SAM-dependent methyltransferase